MDICYALNDDYVDFCCISMVSVMENNTESITFHLLTDSFLPESIKKLTETAERYGAKINFYHVNDQRLSGQKTTWSKYGWYRIFAPELLPESIASLLYLDCDVIVDGRLDDLFKSNDKEWSVAAVPDIMTIFPNLYDRVGYSIEKGYFCSGVLMMNLNYFRTHGLSDKILKFAIDNPDKIHFPDQDALNCVCQDSKILLPLKYGILDSFYRNRQFMGIYREEILESLDDPRIIHYAGCAPWVAENHRHLFYDRFWKNAELAGGIKKTHCCKGTALMKFRIKRFLGIIGISKFRSFAPLKRLNISAVRKSLTE